MKNKKTSANDSSFPVIAENYIIDGGLTKREYFAAMAMQGFITKYGVDFQEEQIKQAIFVADIFIEELNKTKTNETKS